MAWYDFLTDIGGTGYNIFGAAPSENTKIMQEMGLLGEDAVKKAQQKSLLQGLLTTGLSYAAQPKTGGYGSVIPYLAKAGLAGVQAAQAPYERLQEDVLMKERLSEMLREKTKREETEKLIKQVYNPEQEGAPKLNEDALRRLAAFSPQSAEAILQTEQAYKDLSNKNVQYIKDIGWVDLDIYNKTDDIDKAIIKKEIPETKTYEPTELSKLINEQSKYKKDSSTWNYYEDKIKKITSITEGKDSGISFLNANENKTVSQLMVDAGYSDVADNVTLKTYIGNRLKKDNNATVLGVMQELESAGYIIKSPTWLEKFGGAPATGWEVNENALRGVLQNIDNNLVQVNQEEKKEIKPQQQGRTGVSGKYKSRDFKNPLEAFDIPNNQNKNRRQVR
jgi:hypothetical protein